MDDEELDNCSGVASALERCCNTAAAGGAMLCLSLWWWFSEMIVKRKQVRTADSLRRRFRGNGALAVYSHSTKTINDSMHPTVFLIDQLFYIN
jgi:hypothetical protein